MTIWRLPFCLAAAVLFAPIAATAQARGSCQDCHSGRDAELAARGEIISSHLEDFRHSVHYQRNVGCVDCHGGDSQSFDKWRAHRGVRSSRHPASLTNALLLPATCGSCHGPIFAAFRAHPHWKLLQEGDGRALVCTTCHVGMASQLLLPTDAICTSCHGEEPSSLAPPAWSKGIELLARWRDVGELRRQSSKRIRKIRDSSRQHDLQEAYFVADTLWQEAIEIGHGFRFNEWERLIEESGESFAAILTELKKKRED